MDEYTIRVTWEGYGYPQYIKRDPSDYTVAEEDEKGNTILTRHVWDALCLKSEINMMAEGTNLRMQLGDDFRGVIEVISLKI